MVDIIKPDLIWIESRCYRLNEPVGSSNYQEHDLYEDEITGEMASEEGDDDNTEIVQLDNGRYSTSFHISQHYYGSVIGKKAMTKRKIESDTRTEIRIPKMGQDGDITILGHSAPNVKMAKRRINMIVTSTRSRQSPSHFVSVPLNKGNIIDRFNKFKSEILEAHCDRGVVEEKFIAADLLHLTLCVMCLMDNQERILASNLLSEAREKIIIPSLESKPLQIHIKGVSYMREDPHEVHVLYATLDKTDPDTQRLQKIADDVFMYFHNAGFAKSQPNNRNSVKLHITLINSKYALNYDEGDTVEQRESFDASRILQEYADYDFGVIELKEIHLSQMNVHGSDGFYSPTCIISSTNTGL